MEIVKYEKPMLDVITLETQDVITLSVKNDYDPVIGENNNPWAK